MPDLSKMTDDEIRKVVDRFAAFAENNPLPCLRYLAEAAGLEFERGESDDDEYDTMAVIGNPVLVICWKVLLEAVAGEVEIVGFTRETPHDQHG